MPPDSTIQTCIDRANWYLGRIDELLALLTVNHRLDGDDVEQCQSMLREIKNRFSIDKTTPSSDQEATPALIQYHVRMLEAGSRLRMATNTRPSISRWCEALGACRTEVAAYAAEMERRYPAEGKVTT